METVIAQILKELKHSNLSVCDQALDPACVNALLKHLDSLEQQKQLKPAGVGHGSSKTRVEEIRGDWISWIEDWEQIPAMTQYKNFVEALSVQIRQAFFIPIKRFEAHFAVYPPGTFYKKHMDQHRLSKHRQVSLVLYLSEWKEKHGGELLAHHTPTPSKIEPRQGRLVCFMSDAVPHEVLPCHHTRKSLTGWLRDDPL